MTGKRYFVSGYSIWDSYNNNKRVDTRSESICALLNQLNDENKQLKKSIKRQQGSNDECAKLIEEQQKENEQLKQNIKNLKTTLVARETLIDVCEKKFREMGYIITVDDNGYVIE